MSYTALYRKFRPSTFEEVKGQDHIVKTLKNQIIGDRIGHAYLFTGTRGTGKTSVAKIFAKACNCENPQNGNPCGQCKSCISIADGSNMNVVEIDAASNSGVDDVRDIIQEVAFSPTDAKYKVYIIDEVHGLSLSAFNALLKTLEEPPSYVIFILATTEIHKVPQTIKSRCQRYDFHRISIDTITNRLKELMETEGVDAEERGLRYIAKAGDGSMRDSLSLLEQCVGFYTDGTLTYDNVLEVLGAVDTDEFDRLLCGVIDGDVLKSLRVVEEAINDGRDLTQFVLDFAWYLRNLLLIKSGDDLEDILDISSDNLATMKENADKVPPYIITRYIEIFSALADDMRYSGQKRTLLEIAVIRLCKPQMDVDHNSILHRIELLEDAYLEGIKPTPVQMGYVPVTEPVKEEISYANRRPLPEKIPDEIKKVCVDFINIVGKHIKGASAMYLERATITLTPDCDIELVFPETEEGAWDFINKQKEDLETILSNEAGCQVNLVITLNKTGKSIESQVVNIVQQIKLEGKIPVERADFD